MALTDWIGEGHCTEVGLGELGNVVGEYHPEASEYYRVESFIVDAEPKYISCKASQNWSGNSAQILSRLKLFENKDPETGKNYLEATDITTRDVDGWVLDKWRIDIIEQKNEDTGEVREVFKDKLSWIKSVTNLQGATTVEKQDTYWVWDNGYLYYGSRRIRKV